MCQLKVKPALVDLNDGKAFSPEFGDIYATRSGAYGQACAVFLSGGDIAQQWAHKKSFTILENGFGLGTNFLATLKAWREDPERCERLDYVSLECFPVSAEDIKKFCAPELTSEASELAQKWPFCIPGYHTLEFDGGKVRLILIFGDSLILSKTLQLSYDALYLDGFAPSKNPRMWDPELLRNLSRYAKEGATVTTWCTSGSVRRALERAGFALQKKEGFGKKRERLFGEMRARRSKHFIRPVREVIIIGAGLAGANMAYSLSKQGVKVRVIDEGVVPGSAASALSWGILHPHFTCDDSPLAVLSREGFLLTLSRLKDLETQSGECLFHQSGCLQMAHSEEIYRGWVQARAQDLPFRLPTDYSRLINQKEALEVSGLSLKRGGWFFSSAGMVRAGAFCRALIKASGISYRGNTTVSSLAKKEDLWQLIGAFGEVIDEASDVVVCASLDSARLLKSSFLGLESLPGRITLLRDTDLTDLKCPVSGEGYIAHLPDGYCAVGATYELKRNGPWTEESAHLANLQKLDSLLEKPLDVVVTGAYCGLRAAGPGRLPIVGPAVDETALINALQKDPRLLEKKGFAEVDGLWVFCGLGSRGLSMATLCSEMLTSMMLGGPMPAEARLLKTLAPSRHLRRQWKNHTIG